MTAIDDLSQHPRNQKYYAGSHQ